MFRTLLVPLDGFEFSERALPMAGAIARASSASLHLVHVQAPAVAGHLLSASQFEYQGLDLEAYAARHRQESGKHLERVAGALRQDGLEVTGIVLEGRISEVLADHAQAIEADLIVMTTHGRAGASRMWLGSVADALVRHTHVPILMIHPKEEETETPSDVRHILVPLDGSELAERVLVPAATLARTTGARLTVAHVVASHSALGAGLVPLLPDDVVRIRDQAAAYLSDVAGRLAAQGVGVETYLTEDDNTATAVAQAAAEVNADLIALATHGHGGLRRAVLGSVADKVLRSSPLPLLVLRPGDPD